MPTWTIVVVITSLVVAAALLALLFRYPNKGHVRYVGLLFGGPSGLALTTFLLLEGVGWPIALIPLIVVPPAAVSGTYLGWLFTLKEVAEPRGVRW